MYELVRCWPTRLASLIMAQIFTGEASLSRLFARRWQNSDSGALRVLIFQGCSLGTAFGRRFLAVGFDRI